MPCGLRRCSFVASGNARTHDGLDRAALSIPPRTAPMIDKGDTRPSSAALYRCRLSGLSPGGTRRRQAVQTNGVSLSQTKISHREGHEARRIGLEALPLDEHVEGHHGECQPGVKILPPAVHNPLEVAHHGQHGEHRLYEHAVLPLAALTEFEIARITLRRMKGGITQDNHALLKLSNEPRKGVIRYMGRGTVPRDDQAILIQQQTEFPPDHPARMRGAFGA